MSGGTPGSPLTPLKSRRYRKIMNTEFFGLFAPWAAATAITSATLSSLLAVPQAVSCTTFAIPGTHEGIVANNLDWIRSHGLAIVNARNIKKTALLLPDSTSIRAEWTSKYGSLTFNQVSREFPIAGMNEKGLVVENMWLDTSVFQPKDIPFPAINELQWIQYQLDTAATLDEAITNARALRVEKVYAPLHYLICDISSRCATFEHIDGKLVIHADGDLPYPTLANHSYVDSLAELRKHEGFGGDRALPRGPESLTRFIQGTALARAFAQTPSGTDAVAYAFGALGVVSQNTTVWNLVYSPRLGEAHFRTTANPQIKKTVLAKVDLSCKAKTLVYDMDSPQTGDVSEEYVPYTSEKNRLLIEGNDFLPQSIRQLLAGYVETYTRCTE